MQLIKQILLLVIVSLLGWNVEGMLTEVQSAFLNSLREHRVRVVAYSAKAFGYSITGPTNIEEFYEEVENDLGTQGFIIVLFNETFFGSNVIDKEQADTLVSHFKSISQKHKNVAFCINFWFSTRLKRIFS